MLSLFRLHFPFLTMHLAAKKLLILLTLITVTNLESPVLAADRITDAKGNPLPEGVAERVITVGGSLTEIAYALGMEKSIIAVDTTSLYPPKALEQKPNVGYMRALSAEGILSLDPTLILAEEGSGPREVVDLLQEARVPFVEIPSDFSSQGIITKIDMVSRALNIENKAANLIEKVKSEMSQIAKTVSSIKEPKKRVLFIYSAEDDKLMVAGKDNPANAIIELAGGENAMSSISGFKPVSNEAVLSANPDFVLMISYPGSAESSAKFVLNHPGLKNTKAAKTNGHIVMDAHYLLGFGPRTAHAIADLTRKLYPNTQAALTNKN